MPKKTSIAKSKESLFFTDILDKYLDGQMVKLNNNIFSDNVVCEVFEIIHSTGTYILKTICCKNSEIVMLEQARNEFRISKQLSEINSHIAAAMQIREFVDREENETHIEILMEYGGDTLEKFSKALNPIQLLSIIRQTIDGFACLASKGIFHSDIKPRNLVMKDGIVKIIDFGVSKDFKTKTVLNRASKSSTPKMIGGTKEFLPPEVLQEKKKLMLDKIDVYCWGITIYQLITGIKDDDLSSMINPLKCDEKNYEKLFELVKQIKIAGDNEGYISCMISNILIQVLDYNPVKRPSFEALKLIFGDASNELNSMNLQNEKETLRNNMLKFEINIKNEEISQIKALLEEEKAKVIQKDEIIEELYQQLNELREKVPQSKESPRNLQKSPIRKNDSTISTINTQDEEKSSSSSSYPELIRIQVKTNYSKILEFQIDPNSKILEIIKIIEKTELIPSEMQQLFHNDHNLKSNKTLKHYNIKEGSTINLRNIQRDIKIIVKFPDKTNFECFVSRDAKVRNVMQCIFEKRGIKLEKQLLHYNEKGLHPDFFLKNWDIKNESIINLSIIA